MDLYTFQDGLCQLEASGKAMETGALRGDDYCQMFLNVDMVECNGCADYTRRIEVYSNRDTGCDDEFFLDNNSNNDGDNGDNVTDRRLDPNDKKYKPFVSICTPTYNRRPFIPFMLKCFEHQDYPKDRMEWIIIDDGTDPIEDLVKDHPNIKYFKYLFSVHVYLCLSLYFFTRKYNSLWIYLVLSYAL